MHIFQDRVGKVRLRGEGIRPLNRPGFVGAAQKLRDLAETVVKARKNLASQVYEGSGLRHEHEGIPEPTSREARLGRR